MQYRVRNNWLGREDSNLRMAESKSKWFALIINARSEKSRKFDINPYKRLANISESCASGYVSTKQGTNAIIKYLSSSAMGCERPPTFFSEFGRNARRDSSPLS